MNNEKAMFISDSILYRKGARKLSDIPNEVIDLIHMGKLETVNLTEWLVVDHIVLLQNVLNELGLHQESDPILDRLKHLNEKKL